MFAMIVPFVIAYRLEFISNVPPLLDWCWTSLIRWLVIFVSGVAVIIGVIRKGRDLQ
jgi:uncharacterized membrane protein